MGRLKCLKNTLIYSLRFYFLLYLTKGGSILIFWFQININIIEMEMVNMTKNEFILYGLIHHQEIIDKIISDLKAFDHDFDIRLILTEALTNAFQHGNQNSIDKPIYLRYCYGSENMKFEIEDTGSGLGDLTIPKELPEEQILNARGKGLFLINCIADEIEHRKNVLIIRKKRNSTVEKNQNSKSNLKEECYENKSEG